MSMMKRAIVHGKQAKRFVKRNWELIATCAICFATVAGGVSTRINPNADAAVEEVGETVESVTATTESIETTSTKSTTSTTNSTTKSTTTTAITTIASTECITTDEVSTTSVVDDTECDTEGQTVTYVIPTQEGEMVGYAYDGTTPNGDIIVCETISTAEEDITEPTTTIDTVITSTTPITTTTIETTTTETTTTIIVTEPETTTVITTSELPIDEADYILLCNCVAHEAGANNISVYNKALVVEVVMNRVNDSRWPDTISGVITQKYQFTGSSTYAYLGTYSKKVTDSVKEAVNLYFEDPSQFNHGYTGFRGDGSQNYFH